MANITTIQLTDIKRDTVAVLNQNFAALNAAIGTVNRYAANLTAVSGDVPVTHNLGTRDVIVQLWNTSGIAETVQATVLDINSIQLHFNQSFTGRVVVL